MEGPDLNYWEPVSLPPLAASCNTPSNITDLNVNFPLDILSQDATQATQCFSPTLQPYSHLTQPNSPQLLTEYFPSSLTQYPTATTSFAYPAFDEDNLYLSKQNNHVLMDSVIQDEVTRAAKTLFSKRNRTLMSWLNPGLSKTHLKFDANTAWEILPPDGKQVYISQVLGKLAPCTTSLMVNPQLKPSDQPIISGIVPNVNTIDYHSKNFQPPLNFTETTYQPRQRKSRDKQKPKDKKPLKRKVIYLTDDENSCDSGLVVDIDPPKDPPEQKKTKRKYTKRKQREKPIPVGSEGEYSNCSSCVIPVEKKEANTKAISSQITQEQPRVKRKYVKKKLVRKKYTRKPKKQLNVSKEEVVAKEELVDFTKDKDSEDVDIWVELGNDNEFCKSIELMTKDVDSFWETVEDPNSLFLEFDIE